MREELFPFAHENAWPEALHSQGEMQQVKV
jgi:hypothetical protein